MLILPGVTIRPVCEAPDGVKEAYELFEKDFTVYLFDQRSDMPDDYDFDQMCEDVVYKIEELGLKDIYLYGVSMGGVIGQKLSAKYPSLVKKMALCSTVYKSKGNFTEWIKHAEMKNAHKLVDSFMDNVYSKQFNDKFKEAMLVAYKDISDEEYRKFLIACNLLNDFDISDEIADIEKDVLVLGSKNDKVFAYEDMKKLAKKLKAESYFYDEYSHAVYDEAVDIKERIRDFYLRQEE